MSTKKINLNFVFQLSTILSLTIVYIFQWGVMISSPSLRTGTDFMAFYSAGRIAQDYGFDKVYDITLQQKAQEKVVGFQLIDNQVLLYNHLPYLVPILAIFVSENYIYSFALWVAIMLIVYLIASYIFIKSIKKDESDLFILPSFVLFFPFFQSLLLGQDTAILFLGVTLWTVGTLKNKGWLTSVGLALTSVRPHLCILFTIPFLLNNLQLRWKIVFPISILALGSILLIGRQGTLDFIHILQISAEGKWHGMNENAMFNLIGLISRSLPFLSTDFIRALGWAGYIIAIIVAIIFWKKGNQKYEWLISVSMVLGLFFAPHLHYHDLTLLIILITFLSLEKKIEHNLILLISFLLLIFQPLFYVLPYGIYTGLAWWLWKEKIM